MVAAVLAVVFGYRAYRAEDAVASVPAKDAVASAAAATETLLSFRFDTLTTELEAEKGLMTPAYAQRFAATFSPEAMTRLTEHQVRVESTVLAQAPLECGEDCPRDRLQVLVFVDKLTTKAGGEPDYAPNRVVVSMQLVGEEWLVDDITVV